jgi:hypothetical protein
MAMINSGEVSTGFWITIGVAAALVILSLIMSLFHKVA